MYTLNDKIKELVPYEPIQGEFDIRLDANESFLKIPENIEKEVFDNFLKQKYSRYPDPLSKEICTAFADVISVNPENVVAGNGSDELISLLFMGFLMKGEKYATFSHDFSMYNFYGSLSECEGIIIPKNDDFTIDVDKSIEICLENKIRLLIFSNPCNPTSLGLKRKDICKIIESLPDTLVIVDEAYMDFWNESVLDKILKYNNLLILKTCSKAFGMAGIRSGFAIGNKVLIDAIKAIKSPYNLNSYSQTMATTVLKHKDELDNAIELILNSKEELFFLLKQFDKQFDIEVLPSCTNFIVMKTSMSDDIFKFLLSKAVSVRCFKTFLRITAGTSQENITTVNLIKEFLESV